MSDRNWLDFVPRVPAYITATISFISAVIGFIELWRRGPLLVTVVLLTVSAIGGTLACAYVAFSREESSLVENSGVWKYPRARLFALVGLWLIPAAALSLLGYHIYQRNLPPTKILVIVADFDGEDAKKYRVTEIIVDKLRAATAADRDVEVQYLGRTITGQGGSLEASAEGNKRKASIVLWGWYAVTPSNVRVTAHFELLRKPRSFSLNQQTQSLMALPSAIDSFSVQEDLSGQMAYLMLLTVSAARIATGDYDKAIALLTDALNLPSVPERMVDPEEIYSLRASAYFMKGDFDRALADCDQSLQRDVDRIEPYVNRGMVYMMKGDIKHASEDFNQAIDNAHKITYRSAKQNRSLGLAYWGQGAVLFLSSFSKGDARESLKRAVPLLEPRNATEYFARGVAFLVLDEHEKALADFDQAIELSADDPDSYMYYLIRGLAHFDKKNRWQAFSDWVRGTLQAKRKHVDTTIQYQGIRHMMIGVFYMQVGNHAAAVDEFSKVIQLYPYFSSLYTFRGSSYMNSGDNRHAIEDFTRGISLSPDSAINHLMRGIIYVAEEDYDRAIADLNRGLTLAPNTDLNADGTVFAMRGIAHFFKKEYDSAIADLTEALERKQDRNWYVARGRTHSEKKEPDAAIADFNQAIRLKPHEPCTYFHRGVAYKQKGQTQLAITDMKTALPCNPQRVEEELARINRQ